MPPTPPATPAIPDPEASEAAWRAATAAAEAADAARQVADAHRGPSALLPYTRAGRLRRNARAAADAAEQSLAAARADPPGLRQAALAAARAADHAAQAAAQLGVPVRAIMRAREPARVAAHAAHRISAAPGRPRAEDTQAATVAAENTRDTAQAALVALDAARARGTNVITPRRKRRRIRVPAVSARRLNIVVGSLIAVILTATLVALVLGDATSPEAATAAQTLAIAGIGFYFGAAVRRRAAVAPSPVVMDDMDDDVDDVDDMEDAPEQAAAQARRETAHRPNTAHGVSPATLTDWVRSLLALGLTAALPIVAFVAQPDPEALRAYMDALAAVVAFYFGAADT